MRERRPSDTIRKYADGTYELTVGKLQGRTADPDHVAYSIAVATGMDRSKADKLVREVKSIETPNHCEIAFKNEREK